MSYSQFVNDLKELKIKKKGKRPKVSPYKFYPSAAELEAQEALLDELKDYSRRLEAAANSGSVEAVYGVLGATPESFSTKAYDIAQKVSQFNMLAFADFSNLVVGERYFPSQDNKDQILQTWTDNFVNLCKSTNEEMRKKVAGVVSDGVLSGRNLREMIKEVQNTCKDFSRNKAELIATTEVGKLNSAIARNQSESAGIEYYEWSAAMDGRTRESHAVMDGKICKWGDENHYYTWDIDPKTGKRKSKPTPHDRPSGAYKGAPGTDFRCRCVALPYVPEYEDDYEEERKKEPVRGVVQENPYQETENERMRNLENNALSKARRYSDKRKDKAEFVKIAPFIHTDVRRKKKAESSSNEMKTYNKENAMGEIAVRNGYPVVFLHALEREGEKDPDAFMGRLLTDFKRIKISQIEHRLGDAFEQAPNAFIEIEDNVTRREFLRKVKLFLDNARNTDPEKAAKPKRAAAIKKNVVGAILFYFVDGKFGKIKLDEMK